MLSRHDLRRAVRGIASAVVLLTAQPSLAALLTSRFTGLEDVAAVQDTAPALMRATGYAAMPALDLLADQRLRIAEAEPTLVQLPNRMHLMTGTEAMALVTAPFRSGAQMASSTLDEVLACLAGGNCDFVAGAQRAGAHQAQDVPDIDALLRSWRLAALSGGGPLAVSPGDAAVRPSREHLIGEQEHPLRALVKFVLRELGVLDAVRDMPYAFTGMLLAILGMCGLAWKITKSKYLKMR